MRVDKLTVLVLALLLLVPAFAVAEEEEKKPGPYLNLSGFYAFNAYSQNNFFLGRTSGRDAVGGVSDKDEYAIQMVRLTAEFGFGENVKAIVRADMAQGIWGIDNSRTDGSTPGFSELFNSKDTNFITHVDWAYIDANVPQWNSNVKLGRMKFALGNLLVLDQDSDGIILTRNTDNGKFRFGWAVMSEGADSLSDESAIGPGGLSTEDANLYLFDFTRKKGDWTMTPFFAFYSDGGTDDGSAYIPNGLQYNRPRFTPQLSEAMALGLSFNGKKGDWTLKGELDYLQGDDDIANANAGAGQRLDVNDGDLSGYNLYLDARRPAGAGKIGFVFGHGSGDDDPFSGDGNINKIRTNGFFYVTEVWEDSVMPDEEGITPQGLGSPASRAYREFENTTLFQINYSWSPNPKWNVFTSASWMQATEDIPAWADIVDADGDGFIGPNDDFSGVDWSNDLGYEFDVRATYKVVPGLNWVLRGGVFFPGDGAGYLINGTNAFDDTAYELRTTVRFSFGKIKIGA